MEFLPPEPAQEGISGGVGQSETKGEARRQADMWLPRGAGVSASTPEVLDFAVTSGLRRDSLNHTLSNAEDFGFYETIKM